MPKKPKSDAYIVYQLLKTELLDYRFKLDKDDDTIWAESGELTTYMTLEEKALWISDDCQDHLDCDTNRCEPGCFVIKLADPEFLEAVDSILYGIKTRREAITKLHKDPFAIVGRDIRISQLEALLKKNKIRVPKK